MIEMKRYKTGIFIIILLCLACTAGCTAPPQSQTRGYVTIADMDIVIPQGQPPSNTTAIEVIPYIEALYGDLEKVDVLVSAKYAGTDVVVTERRVSDLSLEEGKTHREVIPMKLENGHNYDIWASVWQDGRRQVTGSVAVALPDRTAHAKTIARSLLAVTAIDVMTPDLEADPITLDIFLGLENIGLSPSGQVAAKVKAYNLQKGITAARESATLGTIAGNASTERSIRLTVPNGYDYEIGIEVFENSALITGGTGRVTLAPPQGDSKSGETGKATKPPTLTVTAAPTPIPGEVQVGQFRVVEGGRVGPTQPGFAAVLALLALGAAAYVVRRGRREG
jgi:PGF-CTERM protein